MNKKVTLLPGLAALTLAALFAACNKADSGTVHAQTTTVVEQTPTAEGAIRRCEERWAKIIAAAEDPAIWVEVYDYETPAHKELLSLPAFMSGKADYVYESPTKPKVLLLEDDTVYIDMSVQWLAGRHPMIGGATIGGDENMVEAMDMIETWKWVKNEWHFVEPCDKSEFFRDHPDFLARAQAAANNQTK